MFVTKVVPVIERVRSLNQLLQRYGRHSSSERLKGYILVQTCSKILGFLAEETCFIYSSEEILRKLYTAKSNPIIMSARVD